MIAISPREEEEDKELGPLAGQLTLSHREAGRVGHQRGMTLGLEVVQSMVSVASLGLAWGLFSERHHVPVTEGHRAFDGLLADGVEPPKQEASC